MAVSFDVVQLTDSYAKIKLGNLPTERTLYIDAFLWERDSGDLIYHDQYQIYLYSPVDYYFIEFDRLNEQTWYECRFTICENDYYDDGGSLISGGWIDDGFETSSYSPGGLERFSLSATDTTITVTVTNLQNYDDIVYNLYNSSMTRINRISSENLTETFTGLTGLTVYFVGVFYRYNGSPETIYSINENEYQEIMTQNSGGGSWYYDSVSAIAISTSTTPYSSSYNFFAQNGKFFTFYCDQTGTVEFVSSSPSGGPLRSYFGDADNGYDDDTGIPYSYDDYDTGSFTYTSNVAAGDTYYLWVTSVNNSSFTLEINFTATPSSNFIYTLVSGVTVSTSQVTKRINFAQNTGWIVPITINQAGTLTIYTQADQSSVDDVGFLALSSNANYSPTTGELSSYEVRDDDGHGGGEFSITYPTVSGTYAAAGTYYVYIKGYCNPSSGSNPPAINTILYVSLTPKPSSDSYVYIFNGSQWKKAIPYIYNGSQWKQAQAYIYNGSQWKKCGQ